MFRIFLKIVVEILISILLFIGLVKYTPLFDNIMNKQDKKTKITKILNKKQHGLAVDINNKFVQKIQKQLELQNNTKNSLYKQQNKNKKESESDFFTGTKQNTSERFSCNVPWSKEKIKDGENIIAYKSQHSNFENICFGEIRICDNGKLLGGYQYPKCFYTIDGVNNGKEEIEGATQTNHTLFTFIKGSEWKKEFVQPERYNYPNKKKPDYIYSLDGKRVSSIDNEGNTVWKNGDNNIKNYKVEEVVGNLKDISLRSCTDWNGNYVKNGEYVIAYKNNIEVAPDLCMFQKRYCNDGTLEGGWENKKCLQITRHNIDNKTSIKYKKDGKEINVPRLNVLNQYIDPIFIKKIEKKCENGCDIECNGDCYDIEEIKFEEICKNQKITVKDFYIKNICFDKKCIKTYKKLFLNIENKNIRTGNISIDFFGKNGSLIKQINKEINFKSGLNKFEYNVFDDLNVINLKITYENLCKKNILNKELKISEEVCKNLGEGRPLNPTVEGYDIPCCEGLTFITTASNSNIVGAGQVCAKVGDNICDDRYENSFNSKDCKNK